MDRLGALNAFCRVVEAGGFSAAAAELNISHTVMSKQVRQLEALLGAQLLNRTTRRLALTEAGQAYYERARRILEDLQEADLAVTQHHAAPKGTATTSFIVHDDVARGALAPLLSDFMARARELYALYPHNRHLSPKVRAFIDFASEVYREPRWS